MTPIHYNILANTEQITHEEWLKLRCDGIGGSDLGAILGLSKWRTPLAVYLDKIGQGQAVEETEPMYWGKVLETVVASEFMRRTKKMVQPFPFLMQSKEYPWMLANIDRILLDEEAGLECKIAAANKAREWEDGQVPPDYMAQCYHYMIVTGLRKWYIAVLIGGNKFMWYEIDYEQEVADKLIAEEKRFWHEFVLAKNPPSAWGEDVDILNAINNEPVDAVAYLDGEAHTLVKRYSEASSAIKVLEAEQADAKAKLIQMIGNRTKAVCGDAKISYAMVNTTRLDTDRLKKEQPDICDRYTKKTESRRFSIK